MGTRKPRSLPARLERLQRRFEHWRQTRKIPSRIPGPLWAAAARVAGRYGVSRTATTLRVNYRALQKRVEAGTAAGGGPEKGAANQRDPVTPTPADHPPHRARRCLTSPVSGFLELAPSARVGSCQCTVEWEDASGAKMRVHVQGAEAPDLAALSRSFWELRS